MLPKKNRLTTKEWDTVFKSGRRIKSSSFTLVVQKPYNTPYNKVGISVPKKVGKTAVARNTIKRQYMALLDDFGRQENSTALGIIVHLAPDTHSLEVELLPYVAKI